ncbi:MAG: hypothetical protein CBC83_01690 [Flavobacteriales bacterium TMED123]|nr:MAG: hypothetical protein CBC83_01690 [Flavobacteriales bacterium TMED123]|tara:strand:+ start:6170 stop:6367 length:198 start_codon:yes stop_codon:yes gene_type:complete
MKNNFTLLKALDQLALNQSVDTKKSINTESNLLPKNETIANIIAYAKSVKCHKTKSINKVLLVLN